MKSIALALGGILIGCAAATVTLQAPKNLAHAEGGVTVQQYCAGTGDYNNVQALDAVVKKAGREGWELIGVYRPANLGATFEDYVCFRQAR